MLKRRVLGIELLLGLTLSGATVQAQVMRAATPPVTVLPNTVADELRTRAEALYAIPARLREAAALHEKEATVRSAADPLAVAALEQAARLHAYTGNPARGRVLMQRAAERALRSGEVLRAAHAYIDAAFLALREKDVDRAYTYTAQADLLARSRHLGEADRVGIIRRIDPARAQLGLLEH
jgi:hypothetical protein